MAWANKHGVRHILIEPGRPTQNGYIESFSGKFRDEHLNEKWFESLHQARSATAIWRQDYNEVRPHSSMRRTSSCALRAVRSVAHALVKFALPEDSLDAATHLTCV